MSERRRMLLAIVNQFKWLPYSYTYLYHSLVPQTISGKNVRNKAKFTKIYGESEVRNQLVVNGNFESTYGISVEEPSYESFSVANNTLTFTLTNNIGSGVNSAVAVQTIKTHKYLLVCKLINDGTSSQIYFGINGTDYITENLTANQTKISASILTASIDNTKTYIRLNGAYSSGKSFSMQELQVIDLTQRYPFDTPTTLTDNRVKNILAQGYIPNNLGEIKDMVIGEIGSEPYNLFDEEIEAHDINFTTGVNGLADNNFRTKNFISAVGGSTYTMEYNRDLLGGTQYLMEYDENKNYLGYQGGFSLATKDITLKQETRYVRLQYFKANSGWGLSNTPSQSEAQVCFHRTGTRTGYAPHTQPQTLQLPALYKSSGIGTSKNSWEITNTSHIFTRNNFHYTFTGNESWAQGSSGYNYYATISLGFKKVDGNTIPNALTPVGSFTTYGTITTQTTNNKIAFHPTSDIVAISNDLYANVSSLTNKTIAYQLATPQVITIPKKHLAVVDLGSLSWTYDNSAKAWAYNGNFNTNLGGKLPPDNSTKANIYCSQYTTTTPTQSYGQETPSNVIYLATNGSLKVNNGSSTTQPSGTLFYETDTEVPDITDTFDIEAGGSVNGNLFSWVRNQLVSNGNFANGTTGWLTNNTYGTISASNNKLTYTVVSPTSTASNAQIYTQVNATNVGNKYLFVATIKSNFTPTIKANFLPNSETLVANTKTLYYGFYTESASRTYLYLTQNTDSGSVGNTIEWENVMLIDLTLAFPNNEPTDINDYRIQYILEHGYIPTNTTGTQTSVDTQVLPNVDMSFKCK